MSEAIRYRYLCPRLCQPGPSLGCVLLRFSCQSMCRIERDRPHPEEAVAGASKKIPAPHLAGDLERTGAYRPVTKRAMMTMVKTCITPCTATTKKKLPT